jgi:hypothetical protein
MQGIDFMVHPADSTGTFHVYMSKRIETFREHRECAFGELDDLAREHQLFMLADCENIVRDIRGKISHAFEIRIHSQKTDYQADILLGERVLLQQPHPFLLDAHFECIDFPVRVYDPLRSFTVARADDENAAACILFDQRAETQERLPQ